MIIKGVVSGSPRNLANHLLRRDENERVSVREIKGTVAQDVYGAFHEMIAVSRDGTRCQKPLYHANIDPDCSVKMTNAQWDQSIALLEQRLGLEDHARVVVMHVKNGREHAHVVWSRIDVDEMRAVNMGHNYRKHEQVARQLEKEFGHELVQGAHERDKEKTKRPDRTPDHWEMQQAKRTKVDPRALKEEVTRLWNQSDSGQAFVWALEDSGLLLAPGDTRDFVIVDRRGGVHSLAKRIDGARTADIRAKMADVDPWFLPTLKEACETQQNRYHQEWLQQQEKRKPEPSRPAPEPPSHWIEEKTKAIRARRTPEIQNEQPAPSQNPETSSPTIWEQIDRAGDYFTNGITDFMCWMADYLTGSRSGERTPEPSFDLRQEPSPRQLVDEQRQLAEQVDEWQRAWEDAQKLEQERERGLGLGR